MAHLKVSAGSSRHKKRRTPRTALVMNQVASQPIHLASFVAHWYAHFQTFAEDGRLGDGDWLLDWISPEKNTETNGSEKQSTTGHSQFPAFPGGLSIDDEEEEEPAEVAAVRSLYERAKTEDVSFEPARCQTTFEFVEGKLIELENDPIIQAMISQDHPNSVLCQMLQKHANLPKIADIEKQLSTCDLLCIKELETENRRNQKKNVKQLDYVHTQLTTKATLVGRGHSTELEAEPEAPKIKKEIEGPEIVLSIAIYEYETQIKNQEFLVLGSQYLTELRDKIYCLDEKFSPYRSDISSGGYFFIEDTFYDDLRETSLKYSKFIIDSSHNKHYRTAVMQEVRWIDLTVRIAQKYLYGHFGDCEHYLVINQVRLLHAKDNQDRNEYPLLVYETKLRKKKCRVCRTQAAEFMTINDEMVHENPYFFCQQCFDHFHRTSDGAIYPQKLIYQNYYHE